MARRPTKVIYKRPKEMWWLFGLLGLIALVCLTGCEPTCSQMLTPCGQSPAATFGFYYTQGALIGATAR